MCKYYPGIICPYCEEPIEEYEAKVFDDEDWVHLSCAVEDNDDPVIWGYEGDG